MALKQSPQPGARAQPASRRTHGSTPALATHRFALRVYYEDTDAAGMVYHANYLKFAERGRTELLRCLGFGHRRLRDETGIGFAVRRCTVDYLIPARLEDALTIETTLEAVGGATLAMRQRIRRDGELLVDIDMLVACIGGDGRPRRVPAALLAAIDAQRLSPATC